MCSTKWKEMSGIFHTIFKIKNAYAHPKKMEFSTLPYGHIIHTCYVNSNSTQLKHDNI